MIQQHQRLARRVDTLLGLTLCSNLLVKDSRSQDSLVLQSDCRNINAEAPSQNIRWHQVPRSAKSSSRLELLKSVQAFLVPNQVLFPAFHCTFHNVVVFGVSICKMNWLSPLLLFVCHIHHVQHSSCLLLLHYKSATKFIQTGLLSGIDKVCWSHVRKVW